MEKNSIHIVAITSYSSEGDGIGRINDIAIFVKGAIAGEIVEVKIIKVAKNYLYGKLIRVINASKNRVKPDCIHASECGGCKLRHMNYEEELKFKLLRVNDAFKRIGKIDFKVNVIHGSKDILRYRNKAAFPVGQDKFANVKIGLFQERSHNIIDIDKCLIQSKQAETIISIIRHWIISNKIETYNEKNRSGLVRHILIRTNYKGEVLICIITTKNNITNVDLLIKELDNSSLKIIGLVQNIQDKNTNVILGNKYITLWKENTITDKLCNLEFQLSVPSFFQVNRAQAEILYTTAMNFAKLTKNDTVIDLYCGTGTITLLIAQHAKHVIGVEIVPEAIKNAKHNAKINNINNVEFLCSSAAAFAQNFSEERYKPNAIFVDPPRSGLDSQTINAIIKIAPEKLIYISCDPATLARDLQILHMSGYLLNNAECIDMFPRTHHIETVVLLSK